ncbi:hypothetical protein P8631_22060, partial [Guyparkeria sp. 1SP6A2]|nr:hypothetical protein [Guyparkeria sp. 1SP6A2]
IALHHDHIGAALQLAQRAVGGHKAGAHALFQPACSHLRDPQKLDAIAHIGGAANVVNADPLDPLNLDIREGDLRAKGNRRQ